MKPHAQQFILAIIMKLCECNPTRKPDMLIVIGMQCFSNSLKWLRECINTHKEFLYPFDVVFTY